MTDRELLEKAINWFKIIAEDMERITTGNLPHCAATTKGRAIRAYEFLEKHKEEPVSEDLIAATNNYCVYVRKGYPRVMDETDRYICNAFEAGVRWQKQQMMKEAVESKVTITSKGILLEDLRIEDFDYEDKVKLIVIKEEQ